MNILDALIIAAATIAQPAGDQVNEASRPIATTTVGVEGRVLYRDTSGAALRAAPIGERDPVHLRIADSALDGDAMLYDIRFIAQNAGSYDLRDFLVGADGSPLAGALPIPVAVAALLPEGHTGDLHEFAATGAPRLGGYRLALVLLGAIWLAPPAIIIVRRITRRREPPPPPPDRPPTLADHLRPIVERAVAGELTTPERARLEMLLLGYWEDRLGLAGLPRLDALQRMREHGEAGELLTHLERWLHQRPRAESVDVAALLRPYRHAAVQSPPGSHTNTPVQSHRHATHGARA